MSSVDLSEKSIWLKLIYYISSILVRVTIIGLLAASVIVIIAGFAELYKIFLFFVEEGFSSHGAAGTLSISVTEMIDIFLIGLVLIITALGLYQLFLEPDISLPEWLKTHSLDTLKERLLAVILVILAVTFLGYVATATDGIMIAGLGIAVSLVMIAIGYILSIASSARIEIKRLEKK